LTASPITLFDSPPADEDAPLYSPLVSVDQNDISTIAWNTAYSPYLSSPDPTNAIAYENGARGYAVRIAANGTVGSLEVVDSNTETNVALTDDSNGDTILASQHTNDCDSFTQTLFWPVGGTPDTPVIASTPAPGDDNPGPRSATVGDAPNDSTTVLWDGCDGGSQQISDRMWPQGQNLDPQIYVLSAAGGDAYDPQVAFSASGTATIIWNRFNGANTIVQGVRQAPNGTVSTVQNLSPTGSDATEARVGVDANGDAVVMWTSQSGAAVALDAVQWAANGTVGPVQAITPTEATVSGVLGIDSTGTATFLSNAYDGISGDATTLSARRLEANGTLDATQSLSVGYDPVVAIGPSGQAALVYSVAQSSTSYTLDEADWPAGGSPTSPTVIASCTCSATGAAFDASGDLSVGYGPNGFAVILRPAGGSFGAAQNLLSSSSLYSRSLFGFDPTGSVTAGALNEPGQTQTPQVGRLLADGTVCTPLSESASDAQLLDGAVDNDGTATIAWPEITGTTVDIQGTRVPAGCQSTANAPVDISTPSTPTATLTPTTTTLTSSTNPRRLLRRSPSPLRCHQQMAVEPSGSLLTGLRVPYRDAPLCR